MSRRWNVISHSEMGNPFETLGLDWCPRCRMTVDADTIASHRGGLYVYKRWCPRCGKVIKQGVYAAPIISDKPLPAAALEWVKKPERDRS